jgi:hypothetical protein
MFPSTFGVFRRRKVGHGQRELDFDDCSLIDHELDAVICAMTAAAPADCRLEGK